VESNLVVAVGHWGPVTVDGDGQFEQREGGGSRCFVFKLRKRPLHGTTNGAGEPQGGRCTCTRVEMRLAGYFRAVPGHRRRGCPADQWIYAVGQHITGGITGARCKRLAVKRPFHGADRIFLVPVWRFTPKLLR